VAIAYRISGRSAPHQPPNSGETSPRLDHDADKSDRIAEKFARLGSFDRTTAGSLRADARLVDEN
jgi:hypothetical protein